jgi:DNA-binding transcriptional regulator GbsR (MarR family)
MTEPIQQPEMMKFIDKLGTFHETVGLPKIGGRILGLMLVIDRPVSPEDISDILKVSRSSVSTNLKGLKMFQLIDSIHVPGSRKEFYAFSENAIENMIKIRLSTYEPFRQILGEGFQFVKKNKLTSKHIQNLMDYQKMEYELYTNLLKLWKKRKTKT